MIIYLALELISVRWFVWRPIDHVSLYWKSDDQLWQMQHGRLLLYEKVIKRMEPFELCLKGRSQQN